MSIKKGLIGEFYFVPGELFLKSPHTFHKEQFTRGPGLRSVLLKTKVLLLFTGN